MLLRRIFIVILAIPPLVGYCQFTYFNDQSILIQIQEITGTVYNRCSSPYWYYLKTIDAGIAPVFLHY